jgi:hypothetical protein
MFHDVSIKTRSAVTKWTLDPHPSLQPPCVSLHFAFAHRGEGRKTGAILPLGQRGARSVIVSERNGISREGHCLAQKWASERASEWARHKQSKRPIQPPSRVGARKSAHTGKIKNDQIVRLCNPRDRSPGYLSVNVKTRRAALLLLHRSEITQPNYRI